CQDNEISWIDWAGIDEDGRALADFVRKLTTLRQRLPVLRRGRFLTGEHNPALDVTDARWLSPAGEDLTQAQWDDASMRCFGLVIDGRAQASGIVKAASDATLLLVFNAHFDVVDFTLPEIPEGEHWTCLLDTNVPVRDALPELRSGDVYQVTGRSLLLFALEAPSAATQRVFDRLETALTDSPE
ncbi:glycogen debranching protein GlgX, partial [Burkholderia gladioli]